MVLSLSRLCLPELLLRSFGFAPESQMSAVALSRTTSPADRGELSNINMSEEHNLIIIYGSEQ
jgi:hypothetical protein